VKKVTQSFWLTIIGLLVVSALTGAAMWFITAKLTVAGVYWLVPIFGGLGGAVGGLLRSGNALELCSLREAKTSNLQKEDGEQIESTEPTTYWKICLGTVGEIAIGLGGATAAVFLFGGTLKFEEHDPKTYVLLVSVSFLAGAFGKDVVVTAGERLLREVKTEAKAAKVEAESAQYNANMATAMGYTLQATYFLRDGRPQEALDMTNLALKLDPKNVNAYGEKARALRRLNRLEEALLLVEEGLKIKGDKAPLLYNRACYKLLLGKGTREEILADLKKALTIKSELKKVAQNDPDLQSLKDSDEFQKLIADEPVSSDATPQKQAS
jgi:tetratricopeptide (TPR) repeat protein